MGKEGMVYLGRVVEVNMLKKHCSSLNDNAFHNLMDLTIGSEFVVTVEILGKGGLGGGVMSLEVCPESLKIQTPSCSPSLLSAYSSRPELQPCRVCMPLVDLDPSASPKRHPYSFPTIIPSRLLLP